MGVLNQLIKGEIDGKVKITVQKSYCTPSRHYLTAILDPYGVPFDAPSADRHGPKGEHDPFPAYQECDVWVPRKQAAWAEYLILSARYPHSMLGQPSHIFEVVSKPLNADNKRWARARDGMPPPWQAQKFGNLDGKPCGEAKRALDKALKDASPERAKELERYFEKYQKGDPRGMVYKSSKPARATQKAAKPTKSRAKGKSTKGTRGGHRARVRGSYRGKR